MRYELRIIYCYFNPMRIKILFILLFLLSFAAIGQTFTDSNLPIVIITTDKDPNTGLPIEIPDDPKVLASMKIIYHPDGSRNYLTDINNPAYLNYDGRIGIELRGSSSQALPKKPYGLTTLKSDNTSNNNVSILGMPKENDWVLNSLAFDSALMRDYLSYDLSRDINYYAARGQYCEVVVNDDYKGLYVFMEKLKINGDRINIIKMTKTDNADPAVTGGYITKSDKTTGGDPVAWTMPSYTGGTVDFIHESPKPEDITSDQNTYIFTQFDTFKNMMTAQNTSITSGYPSVIDVPSFVDFMIINEISSNVDAYQFSTFFHKDRAGKLRAGPVWDLNLTYGNDLFMWGFDRSHTDVWQFDNGDNIGPTFWRDLYNNPTFKCYLTKRWKEVTASNQPLNYNVISGKIDAVVSLISEAAVRENTRWNTVGNLQNNADAMKGWLQVRINWMNSKLTDFQSCANRNLAPLVITKIHYNPLKEQDKESNDLEYISITNNSNQSYSLTGFYFQALGISYQFPPNTTIAANQEIFLASNAATFQAFYGLTPFGQFTRNLSNSSQKIVLADAFGNTIDHVEYLDTAPWPAEPDGSGPHLELNDLNSDNSVATNWTASSKALAVNDPSLENTIILYPNPIQSTIRIQNNKIPISSYEIYDLIGRKMISKKGTEPSVNGVDISQLKPNTYFIKLNFDNGASTTKKIIKY
jgi:hypothetical protein